MFLILKPHSINDEDIKIIRVFAKLALKTRNPGSHGQILNKQVFLKNISDFIDLLNKVIIILNKIYLFLH